MFLFIFRESGREGEREGEKHQSVVASHTPHHWGPGLQPRHVPWPGIRPVTLCFIGWHSIHWATPARAKVGIFKPNRINNHIRDKWLNTPCKRQRLSWCSYRLLTVSGAKSMLYTCSVERLALHCSFLGIPTRTISLMVPVFSEGVFSNKTIMITV